MLPPMVDAVRKVLLEARRHLQIYLGPVSCHRIAREIICEVHKEDNSIKWHTNFEGVIIMLAVSHSCWEVALVTAHP